MAPSAGRNLGRDGMIPDGDSGSASRKLGNLLETAGLKPIDPQTAASFDSYLALILRWNARMNLTAIRDPEEILSRHFVESIACAQALPLEVRTLLDFGSGAGLPGIPIALCRPEISVTLAESQTKKSAFLQEVVRSLQLNSSVFAGRAENLHEQFDCVTLRAVDRMEQAVAAGSVLVRPGGWLGILTTRENLKSLRAPGIDLLQAQTIPLSGSEQRLLILASKTPSESQ